MLKIVFVLPNLSSGGAERVVSIISSEMVCQGFLVDILLIHNDVIRYSLDSRVQVVSLNTLSLTKYQRILKIRSYFKNERKNNRLIVIPFHETCLNYSLVASIGLGLHFIGTERNDPNRKGKTFVSRLKAHIPFLFVDKIVFQTHDARDYYQYISDIKTVVIPNPIVSSNYIWNGDLSPSKLVSICRLNHQKNLDMTIMAIEKLKLKFPDIRIVIYGEGEEKKRLIELIDSKGLSNNIVLAGYTKDTVNVLANSSIFVSSSDYEGISNSMLEAMSVGMPIVCTDCPIGGAKMMLNNGAGLLIKVGNVDDLVAKLDYLFSNPIKAKELGSTALMRAKDYSVRKITEMWISVIKSVKN